MPIRTVFAAIALTVVPHGVSVVMAQAAQQAVARGSRASWTSDRRLFQVGDILTVLIDEQAVASERTDRVASSERGQSGSTDLSAGTIALPSALPLGLSTGMDASSRDNGRSDRRGTLFATMSVRVAAIEPDGSLRVEGTRMVQVDGRQQELELTGLVRSEDVNQHNMVLSSRLANANISYKGKGIGPKKGIIGKILGIFWP